VKVEVRAIDLNAMSEKRGLTQRKVAHDLGISPHPRPSKLAPVALDRSSRSRWFDTLVAGSTSFSRS